MRYFFNSSGKCIAIITENPRNLDVPKEAANAAYAYDGDKGRSLNTVFLDKTYVMQNGITVTLSASPGSSYGYVYVTMTASCIPLTGITIYARGGSSGSVGSVTVNANGTYHIGINSNYAGESVSVWATTPIGNYGSASTSSCQCYSCDCGGGN